MLLLLIDLQSIRQSGRNVSFVFVIWWLSIRFDLMALFCERIEDGYRVAMIGLGALLRNATVVVVAYEGEFLDVTALCFRRRAQRRRNGGEIKGSHRGTVGVVGAAVIVVVLQTLGREGAVLVEAGLGEALVKRARLQGTGWILWEVTILVMDMKCRVVGAGVAVSLLGWYSGYVMCALVLMGLKVVLAVRSVDLVRMRFSRPAVEAHVVFVFDGACRHI